MSSSKSGWRAECQTCPTTPDLDYGGQIKVHAETETDCDAHMWAVRHRAEHFGHHVTVTTFVRMTFDRAEVNPELWRVLGFTDRNGVQ